MDIGDFFEALKELERDMKIDSKELTTTLEAGLASAFKKDSGDSRAIKVTINPEEKYIRIYAYYKVVEEPEEDYEITLDEAREMKANAQIGDIIGEDVTPADLSRIATQTASQVIKQRINEARKNIINEEMSEKEGELVPAIVRRVDPNAISVEIIGTQVEGIMSKYDQVFGEKLSVNDKIKVYVKKVRTTDKGGSQVYVSRSSPYFVKKLFEIEVPELRSNLVKVKNIVREAGYRTKMAVYSDEASIDSIGACIGPKGARVNEIVSELKGEKIDVILYSNNPSEYITRALSPAKVLLVRFNEILKQAEVVVPDDKLSLAIGKNGQNARLAAKLTGYKIDVIPYSKAIERSETGFDALPDTE
ncbi:MAG: transcription termination factor NusA [Christensenellales bacterium]|jgi:N utilization substance protein A|nr:transcription termination/antitermination protein NusA [Clostridiales bacterium]